MMITFGMSPRDVLTIAMMTTGLVVAVTSGAPTNSDAEDYDMLADKDAQSTDKGNKRWAGWADWAGWAPISIQVKIYYLKIYAQVLHMR